MKLKAIIHEAEEGGFWAEVPALPGCVTQGETKEELEYNLRESIEAWLEAGECGFETKQGRIERVVIPIHGNQSLKMGVQRSPMKIIPVTEDEL